MIPGPRFLQTSIKIKNLTTEDTEVHRGSDPHLEMLAQFGEAADDEQFLLRRSGVDLFVLEDPGVAMRNEDGV
jgi:hypothetical protein